MYRVILLSFIILSFSNCKTANLQKDTATNQLHALKNGVLLVRLPTNKAKVTKLKEMKKSSAARKEKTLMYQFHKDILRAFDAHFSFCPVYFYHSDVSNDIKAGKFEGNLFDSKKQPINDLDVPQENRYFAEFGFVHQEELTKEQNGKTVKVAGIGGKKAFVIRTHEGFQPERPFPYSVNYYRSANDLSAPIKKINSKLFKSLAQMEKREMRRKRRG